MSPEAVGAVFISRQTWRPDYSGQMFFLGIQESGSPSLKTRIGLQLNGANVWRRSRGMMNGLIHTQIHSALMGFSRGTHTTGQIRLHLMLCKMITSISGGIYSIAALALWLCRKDLLLCIAKWERRLRITCSVCAGHLRVHINLKEKKWSLENRWLDKLGKTNRNPKKNGLYTMVRGKHTVNFTSTFISRN